MSNPSIQSTSIKTQAGTFAMANAEVSKPLKHSATLDSVRRLKELFSIEFFGKPQINGIGVGWFFRAPPSPLNLPGIRITIDKKPSVLETFNLIVATLEPADAFVRAVSPSGILFGFEVVGNIRAAAGEQNIVRSSEGSGFSEGTHDFLINYHLQDPVNRPFLFVPCKPDAVLKS